MMSVVAMSMLQSGNATCLLSVTKKRMVRMARTTHNNNN